MNSPILIILVGLGFWTTAVIEVYEGVRAFISGAVTIGGRQITKTEDPATYRRTVWAKLLIGIFVGGAAFAILMMGL